MNGLYLRNFETLVYSIIWEKWRICTLRWDSLTTWWLCFLGVDLCYYIYHRYSHGNVLKFILNVLSNLSDSVYLLDRNQYNLVSSPSASHDWKLHYFSGTESGGFEVINDMGELLNLYSTHNLPFANNFQFAYLPLAFFIPPSIFLTHLQLSELNKFWIHTEVIESLGPLEWILNTPSNHRVHHGKNIYAD